MPIRRKRKKPPYIHDKFERKVTAWLRNTLLIKRLRRLGTNESINLAVILEGCSGVDGQACGSGACHLCMRNQRLQLFEEGWLYIQRSLKSESMTIIPLNFAAKRGELYRIDLVQVKKWIARGLRDVLPRHLIAIGGIDVSINSKANADFEWVVHAHIAIFGLAEGETAKALRSRIKKRFALGAEEKALCIKDIKFGEEIKATSYCMKPIFNWRSTYWKTKNLPRRRAPHWATRKNRPKWMDEVELRIWLARWTFAARLILVGITNPAAPNSIRLSDSPRTPKPPKTSEGQAPAKVRVTRGNGVKWGKPR